MDNLQLIISKKYIFCKINVLSKIHLYYKETI